MKDMTSNVQIFQVNTIKQQNISINYVEANTLNVLSAFFAFTVVPSFKGAKPIVSVSNHMTDDSEKSMVMLRLSLIY